LLKGVKRFILPVNCPKCIGVLVKHRTLFEVELARIVIQQFLRAHRVERIAIWNEPW
jgi:hypothetical protein